MKIIAETKDGFLVDMSKDEIATIQGISWVDKRFNHPKAGDEINISKVYDTVASLSYDQDISELKRHGDDLLRISSWLKIYKEKQSGETRPLKYDRNPI